MYLAAKLLDFDVLHKRMDLCVLLLPKDDLQMYKGNTKCEINCSALFILNFVQK